MSRRSLAPTPTSSPALAGEKPRKKGKQRTPSSSPGSLLRWEQLQPWQRDNEYILSGYRSASGSWKVSIISAFMMHNETVNIHSHLAGCLMFLLLPLYAYGYVSQRGRGPNTGDAAVFTIFTLGVATCFFLSATFHVIANHSLQTAAFGNQLDYLGVVILMWGATIPTVYYGFHDEPVLQRFYWIVVTVLALVCAATTFHPRFRSPTLRVYRAIMYAGLGLSAVGFIVHGISIHGGRWHDAV